jgi:hypothetical protein
MLRSFGFVAILSLCFWSITATAIAQNNVKPCSGAEAREFDFWIGDWGLTWDDGAGGIAKGFNTIESLYDGCVIRENFRDSSQSFFGMSVSAYSTLLKKWQQTWVDNQGAYLDFTGEFKDGKMTLERSFMTAKGKKLKQRMIFYNIAKNELDWNWEKSDDEGKTWTVAWKIHYKRKNS